MNHESSPPTSVQRLRGCAVHVYTASGVIFAFLAMKEIISPDCDPRWVFGWLLASVFIDATDGPLARRFMVKQTAPSVDGRTIDDLLDYLTFAFIPLVLLERMNWLPVGWGWTVTLAMMASLFGFAHVQAKYDEEGFFRGFPSYWNIFVFYAGWMSTRFSPWISAVVLWLLAIMTVSPVRLFYPNRAPSPWRAPVLIGSAIWAAMLLAMLPTYPASPDWLMGLSLIFPAAYFIGSVVCDVQLRRQSSAGQSS